MGEPLGKKGGAVTPLAIVMAVHAGPVARFGVAIARLVEARDAWDLGEVTVLLRNEQGQRRFLEAGVTERTYQQMLLLDEPGLLGGDSFVCMVLPILPALLRLDSVPPTATCVLHCLPDIYPNLEIEKHITVVYYSN